MTVLKEYSYIYLIQCQDEALYCYKHYQMHVYTFILRDCEIDKDLTKEGGGLSGSGIRDMNLKNSGIRDLKKSGIREIKKIVIQPLLNQGSGILDLKSGIREIDLKKIRDLGYGP